MEKASKSGRSSRIHPVELDGSKTAITASKWSRGKQHGESCKPYIVSKDEFETNGMEPSRSDKDVRTAGV